MLQLRTDLLKVNRLEKVAHSTVLTTFKTGSWASLGANNTAVVPAVGGKAYPIWTESKRDGTAGFTGDVSVTKGVTLLNGIFEGKTDQFTGTPAIGDKLYVLTTGKLTNATGASLVVDATAFSAEPTVAELETYAVAQAAASAANPVAICTKASAEMEWFGNTISVIEFITL